MVRPGRRSDLLSELSDLLAYSGVKSDRRRDDKIDAGHPMQLGLVSMLFVMQIRHSGGNLNERFYSNSNTW